MFPGFSNNVNHIDVTIGHEILGKGPCLVGGDAGDAAECFNNLKVLRGQANWA